MQIGPLDKAYSQKTRTYSTYIRVPKSRQIGHVQKENAGKTKFCSVDYWDFENECIVILTETRIGYTSTPNNIGIFQSYITIDMCDTRKQIRLNQNEQNNFPPSCCILYL